MNAKNVLKTVGLLSIGYFWGKCSGIVRSQQAVNRELGDKNLMFTDIHWDMGKRDMKADLVKLAKEVEES